MPALRSVAGSSRGLARGSRRRRIPAEPVHPARPAALLRVAKNVTSFIETDAGNLGKTVAGLKNISPQVIVQDAYGEIRFHNALQFDLGLMFVPFPRNSVQSAASLLPIDYGRRRSRRPEHRLEYRIGAFQGARDAR